MRVADPEVASVPPCAVFKNWDVLTPWFAVRYLLRCISINIRSILAGTEITLRKVFKSALKLVIVPPLVGRNEKTSLDPFEPLNKFLQIIQLLGKSSLFLY